MTQLLDYLGTTHQPYLHAKGEVATEFLIQWLDCQSNEKILEFGVGTGGTLVKVVSRYRNTQFFGVDFSEKMIEKSTDRLKFCQLFDWVELKKTDGKSLNSFKDSFFDKIYVESVLGIQEEEALRSILLEFHRILKPNGTLVMNETLWLESTDCETIREFNEFAKKNFGIIQANGSYPYLKDWVSLLKLSHFDVLKTERVDNLKPGISPLNFNEKLSKLFTILGGIYGKLFLKKEFIEFEKASKSVQSEQQLMEGYLMMAVNSKPHLKIQ
jgi:ubiquinone/menaquinone biosynthesis C-methylase UbiE